MGIDKNKNGIRGIRYIIIKIMVLIFLMFSISLILLSFLSRNEFTKIEHYQNRNVSLSLESLIKKQNIYFNSIIMNYSCFSWMVTT